jgi:hypothetical protein
MQLTVTSRFSSDTAELATRVLYVSSSPRGQVDSATGAPEITVNGEIWGGETQAGTFKQIVCAFRVSTGQNKTPDDGAYC